MRKRVVVAGALILSLFWALPAVAERGRAERQDEPKTRGERHAAEQKAREERQAAEQKAREVARDRERLAQLRVRSLKRAAELEAKADALLKQARQQAAGLREQGHAARKEADEARKTLEAAAKLNPGSRAIMRRLGQVYKETENKEVKIWVKGKAVEARPIVRSGRTLVPLRALAESLDAQVEWDAETRTVTFTRGDNTVQMVIGSRDVLVNGQPVQLDVPAAIENGRTIVPLRAVAELLSAEVDYDPETGNVIVVDPLAEPPADATAEGTGSTAGPAPTPTEADQVDTEPVAGP